MLIMAPKLSRVIFPPGGDEKPEKIQLLSRSHALKKLDKGISSLSSEDSEKPYSIKELTKLKYFFDLQVLKDNETDKKTFSILN